MLLLAAVALGVGIWIGLSYHPTADTSAVNQTALRSTIAPVGVVGRHGVIVGNLAFGFTDYTSYRLYYDTPSVGKESLANRMTDARTMVWPAENQPVIVTDTNADAYQVQTGTGARWWLASSKIRLDP